MEPGRSGPGFAVLAALARGDYTAKVATKITSNQVLSEMGCEFFCAVG